MDRSTSLWLAIIGFSLLGTTALYSCVPHIEEDLRVRAIEAAGADATPTGWASIEVDGQMLILSGVPPDSARGATVLARLRALDGVTEVDDRTAEIASGLPEDDNLDNDTGDDADGSNPGRTEGPGENVQLKSEASTPPGPLLETAAGLINPNLSDNAREIAGSGTSGIPPAMSAAEQAVVEASAGRPLLTEPLTRCQRDIDQLLTASGSFFPSASAVIAKESLPVVDQIGVLLARCAARAEIAGHTDNSGAKEPNQRLSQARADAIRTRLISQGVAEVNLTAVGHGEDSPIVSNLTPEGRRQNRRIEVRIVEGEVTANTRASIENRT